MFVQPGEQFVAVEPAQRDRRQFHLEPAAVAEYAVHENLAGIFQADAVRAFVQGAGQDQTPEAIDSSAGLMVPG